MGGVIANSSRARVRALANVFSPRRVQRRQSCRNLAQMGSQGGFSTFEMEGEVAIANLSPTLSRQCVFTAVGPKAAILQKNGADGFSG